jgi:putative oxidoreductase
VKFVVLLGRVLFSFVFLVKAVHHFTGKVLSHTAHTGLPMLEVLIPILGVIGILGALSVILGYKARIGAWLLIVFLIPPTFLMHTFWVDQEGQLALLQTLQTYCFIKNLSLIGACLMITYFGSGPLSLSKK